MHLGHGYLIRNLGRLFKLVLFLGRGEQDHAGDDRRDPPILLWFQYRAKGEILDHHRGENDKRVDVTRGC